MEKDERKDKMTMAFQQMAGATYAMSAELGANDTMEVLAAVVAYAVLINQSRDEKKDLDTFRKNVESQMEEQRPQVNEILRNIKDTMMKMGE